MKRHSSSDQLIPICPSGEDQGVYGRGFPSSMLDMEGEDCGDDELLCSVGGGQGSNGCGEKKRRLSVEQVRALETSFEVENKLEPERKLRLAQELGLQPRQVAIWFQNRRARWKTKRLERDYNALKANYDLLRVDYDALLRDKESLLAEIKELKTKLSMDENLSSSFVKEEPLASESEDKISEEQPALIYKDGSVDSDSSVVLNDENSSQLAVVASNNMAFDGSTPPFTTSFSSSLFVSSDAKVHKGGLLHGHHYLKVEESGFLSGDEPCSSSFFSDEQPPSLSWYYGEQWN